MSFLSAIGDFLTNPIIKGSNADESTDANSDSGDNSSPGLMSKVGDFLKGGASSIGKGLERVATFLHNHDPLSPSMDPNNPSAMDYVTHGFIKGGTYLPDAMANVLSGTASKAYEKMYGEKPPINIPHDPFESALNYINPYNANLKPAEGYVNQLAEGAGNAIGSVASAGALTNGTPALQKFLGFGDKFNPAAASTITGLGSQVVANPIIQDSDLPRPLKAAASTGIGLAGGLAGGKIASKFAPMADVLSKPVEAPETPEVPETPSESALPNDEAATQESAATAPKTVPVTAAQKAIAEGSENAPELKTKQLEIVGKYPKAARTLQQFSQAQHQDIADTMQSQEEPEAQVQTGQQVKQDIINTLKTMHAQKKASYDAAEQEILDKYNSQQEPTNEPSLPFNEGEIPSTQSTRSIDVTSTQKLLDGFLEKTPKTTSTGQTDAQRALLRAKDLIESNQNSPEGLIGAKRQIQKMVDYDSGYNVDSSTDAQLKATAHQLKTDIESALPGYAELNEKAGNDIENINTLLNGSKKIVKLADLHPEQVARQLFEKTSPEVHEQLMGAVSPQTSQKAADMYMDDVFRRGAANPTSQAEETMSNITGPGGKQTQMGASQFQAIGKILKKNLPVLQQTLPEPQLQRVNHAIEAIDQNAYGLPQGDYVANSYKSNPSPSINIGEAANADASQVPGLIGKMAGFLTKPITNQLNYNQMMTGQSPMSQIGAAGLRAGLKGATAATMNAPNNPTQQPTPSAQLLNANFASPVAPVKPTTTNANQTNAFDAVLQKYGINNGSTPKAAAPNAFDAVLAKYGINNNSAPAKTSQQADLEGRRLSSDELNFIHQKLRDNDVDSLVNFDNSFKQYQVSFDPLLQTLRKRESGDNYQNMRNPYGYVGAYQFGAPALETVGLVKPGVSKQGNSALRDPNNWNIPGGLNTFLSSPQIQDQAARKLLSANQQVLQNAGVINANTPVSTRNGYLAAAHLKGAQGAINLFHGKDSADAFGTRASDYYRMGAGI